MTFRRDSDIVDLYGPIFVAKLGANPPYTSYTYKQKPKGLLRSTYVFLILSILQTILQLIGSFFIML